MRKLLFFSVLVMTVGCGSQEIRQQAEESHDDKRVSGIFPSHDSMALRGDVQIQIVLGEEMLGVLPNVHLVGQHDTWTPNCTLDDTDKWITCDAVKDLPRNQVFDLEIGLHDQNPLIVTPTSEFPDDTPGFLLNTNSRVTSFGEDASTAKRIGEMFQSNDMVMLIDGYNGKAGDYNMLAGPIDIEDNGKASIRSPGLTFVKHIVVDNDGFFTSTQQNVFMPIFVDTGFVQMLIQNCRVSGHIEDGQLSGLKIDGDIPAISLVKLADPLGPAANFVLGNITMDVDLDGDGEEDAAYFSLVSNAPRISMVQY